MRVFVFFLITIHIILSHMSLAHVHKNHGEIHNHIGNTHSTAHVHEEDHQFVDEHCPFHHFLNEIVFIPFLKIDLKHELTKVKYTPKYQYKQNYYYTFNLTVNNKSPPLL